MTELEHLLDRERKIATAAIAEIKKLEEQLQNAITPKFKVGQTVWYISEEDTAIYFVIDEIFISVNSQGFNIAYNEQGFLEVQETFLFATRAEAEKALAERGVK